VLLAAGCIGNIWFSSELGVNFADNCRMKFKSLILKLGTLLAPLTVIVSISYAQAPRCEDVFQSSALGSDSIPKVKAVHEEQIAFVDFLKSKVREMKKGDLIEQSEIQEWINRIDSATFEYFKDAGILYKKVPVVRKQVQIGPAIVPELTYNVYRIESSSTTTPTARLLNGTLQQSKLNGLKITYEPMLFLLRPGSPGQYDPAGKELYFSVDALVYRMIGIGDPLRHELNHALEDAKVYRGKPTLASFEFKQGKRKDHGYSDYLALDEVESYLRDLRYLKFHASRQDKFVDDTARLETIKNMRKESIQTNVKFIKMIISSARETLKDLKTQNPIGSNIKDGTIKMVFMGLENQYYDGAVVTLHPAQNQMAKEALLERIDWSEKRLIEVESELNSFEK
jgi:hypothetical protein